MIEDEIILTETISEMILDLGHQVVEPVNSLSKALLRIEQGGFDLVILDINLKRGEEGIEIGKVLYEKEIPFFFLTSYTDPKTVKAAKGVRPGAYVVKPFTEKDLFIAIEMSTINLAASSSPSISVRKGNAHSRINVDDICFLKAENIYTQIYTHNKSWLKRSSLKDMLDELKDERFIQTHRSYAVNLDHVEGWSNHTLMVQGKEVPVSRRQWDAIKELLEAKFY